MSARPALLLSLLQLPLLGACSNNEPSATEPDPDARPEVERALVEISLSLVDSPTRAAVAARFDPNSALVQAEVLLAVHHEITAPWHIYWTNPGESGLRTKLTLTGTGFEAGPVAYPGPERFTADGGQVSFGWERDVVLFVPLSKLEPDARLELRSDWLACHESCIPGHATITAKLSELDVSQRADAMTTAMLARLPEPAGDRVIARWTGTTLHVEATADAGVVIHEWFPHAHARVTLESAELRDTSLDLVYRWTTPPSPELGQGVLALVHGNETTFIELAIPWPT